jgi:hypothetical protein
MSEPRMHQLIRQPRPIVDRVFEIEFAGPQPVHVETKGAPLAGADLGTTKNAFCEPSVNLT